MLKFYNKNYPISGRHLMKAHNEEIIIQLHGRSSKIIRNNGAENNSGLWGNDTKLLNLKKNAV